jgi:hypothetical protein
LKLKPSFRQTGERQKEAHGGEERYGATLEGSSFSVAPFSQYEADSTVYSQTFAALTKLSIPS